MYRQLQNDELLRRIGEDDQNAFGEIYARFSERILRFVAKRLGSWDDAEEVLQETFISLWNSRINAAKSGNLEPYLVSIAKFTCFHYRLKAKRSPLVSQDDFENLKSAMGKGSEVDFRFLMKSLNEEIDKLPEKSRLIFIVHNEGIASVKEIARMLNMSEDAVYKSLQRTIFTLKKSIIMLIPFVI